MTVTIERPTTTTHESLLLHTITQSLRTELTALRAENETLRDRLADAEFALRRDPAAIYGAEMARRVAG